MLRVACRMLSGVRLGSGGVGERMGGIGSLHGTCILNTTATGTCTSGVCGKYAEINHVKHVKDQCTVHVQCTCGGLNIYGILRKLRHTCTFTCKMNFTEVAFLAHKTLIEPIQSI